jgi:mono/diheme cytochrome c family protein
LPVRKAIEKREFPGNPSQGFANSGLAKNGELHDARVTAMKKLIFLALPAAFALALTTNALAADGKAVYADNCAKCHGDDGKGATKMGTKLGAKDYTDAAVQAAVSDDQAFKSIKEGLKKDDKTLMKPSELSDEDIKASVAFLRTLKK